METMFEVGAPVKISRAEVEGLIADCVRDSASNQRLARAYEGLWLPRPQLASRGERHGYETTVRPSLLWGTYRTQDKDPAELEERLERGLAGLTNYELRWGGSAAGFRLTGHYRGARTVAHVRSPPNDLQRRLPAMEDPSGNLVLMDAFGTLNWQPERRTVHPLLVYSEILREGTERAREAAQELYEEHLLPTWEQVD